MMSPDEQLSSRDEGSPDMDYSAILRRLVPPGTLTISEPVHDVCAFLRARFGDPERTAISEETTQLAFREGDAGIHVYIETSSSRVVGLTSLAFGLPLWTVCPQSRFSGVWVAATGTSWFVPILGSLVGATATALALALLDYTQQVANLSPGLCQGLCTSPCWCVIDPTFPTRNTTVTTRKTIFGIPVLLTVTVTLSGWVRAHCERWDL